MDGKQVSVEDLKQALAVDFDQFVAEVARTMNAAQAGRIIADTEEPVRQANAVFRERAYAKAIGLLQSQQEAFSPSARRPAKQRGAADEPPDGQRASGGA
jgi:predicted RecB family endonuclease